jgi:phosphate transport system permease protein
MKHAIIGTIEQVGMATAVTVPIGVGTALYLNEIGGRLAGAVRLIVDAMSGVPSIIAGLFVYIFWVQPRHTEGFSGLAASMALGILMLPTITRTAEEVLRIVAGSLREAALALGAPEWRMICLVVVPTARAGLVTAGILGVARAVGETAPVLLTAFGSRNTNWNPFHGPQADLPLQVYQLARSPLNNNVKEAWAGAAVLIAIVLTLFTLARVLSAGGGGRGRRKRGGATPAAPGSPLETGLSGRPPPSTTTTTSPAGSGPLPTAMTTEVT